MSNQEEYLLTSKLSQTCDASEVKTRAKTFQPVLTDVDKEAVLVPITPFLDRENGECQHVYVTSPLTLVPTPPEDLCDQSGLNDGPSSAEDEESFLTPRKDAFDPFAAAGPDECDRENGECRHVYFASPFTFDSTPQEDLYDQSGLNDGPSSTEDEESFCTPKKGIFDPFAPGPDECMLAPRCRKYAHELQIGVVRRLNFQSKMDSNVEIDDGEDHVGTSSDDDEILLETVSETLFEAIMSIQAAEMNAAQVDFIHAPVPDGFKTPISAHRLSGVAETCPPAPVKPTNKFRNIDKGLCRRLEF